MLNTQPPNYPHHGSLLTHPYPPQLPLNQIPQPTLHPTTTPIYVQSQSTQGTTSHLTNNPNDFTTASTNSNFKIFYPSTISNILREYNDCDRRWPLNSTPHTLPRKVATMIATNTKLYSNASSQKPPPKIPTTINTLRNYFTTKKPNANTLEHPHTNPQTNNNNDAKHPERSKTTSKTAALIQKIKK